MRHPNQRGKFCGTVCQAEKSDQNFLNPQHRQWQTQAKSRFSAAGVGAGSEGRSVFCGKCATITAVAGVRPPTPVIVAPFPGSLLVGTGRGGAAVPPPAVAVGVTAAVTSAAFPVTSGRASRHNTG